MFQWENQPKNHDNAEILLSLYTLLVPDSAEKKKIRCCLFSENL